MGNTKTDLVEVLKKRNDNHLYDQIIYDAAHGRFHDFESDEVAPKMVLVAELRKFPELSDVVNMVMQGEFDD